MSGGSFNYLYTQDEPAPDDLRAMAKELERRGMKDAARATRALIPHQPDAALTALWQAVERNVSGDAGEDKVREALLGFHSVYKSPLASNRFYDCI